MTDPVIVDLDAQPVAVVVGELPTSELRTFYDRAFTVIPEVLAAQGIVPTGPPFGWYDAPPTEMVSLRVGFPVDRAIAPEGDVEPWELPAGRVARLVHEGSFDDLGASWGRLVGWLLTHGHQPGPGMWETYLVEPTPDMDPADLRTELNCPLA